MAKFKYYALKLSLLIIIIFILQLIIPGFTDMFILNKSSFFQLWRFLTSIFLHSGTLHLIYNLFALALFGSILEKFIDIPSNLTLQSGISNRHSRTKDSAMNGNVYIGGKRLLIVFFVSGILANLVSVNFYNSSLGASGAIFGIIGTLVVVRPLMVIWAFGLPMPMFIAGILWAIGDILGAYGFLVGNPIDNTGNIAHLSGMFFGFLFGLLYRRLFKNGIRRENVSIDEGQVRLWERGWMR